jgi:hypothetical protein
MLPTIDIEPADGSPDSPGWVLVSAARTPRLGDRMSGGRPAT